MKQIIFITSLTLVFVLLSCGDMLSYKKQITGKYYLLEGDTREDLSICYKVSSDQYIVKIPSQVVEYGFNERYLVAKSIDLYTKQLNYFIIDMTNDFDVAKEENFRIGPMTLNEYNTKYKNTLNIQLNKIER